MAEVDNEIIMSEMAKISLKQATSQIAKQARKFAKHPGTKLLTGETALTLFADTIESTNAKVWPKGANS